MNHTQRKLNTQSKALKHSTLTTHSQFAYTDKQCISKAYQDPSNFDTGVKGQQEFIWKITGSKQLLKPERS